MGYHIDQQYPILRTIPADGAVVLGLRNGQMIRGTEATTEEDRKLGLIRLEATDRNSERMARHVHAADIVTVEYVFTPV